MPAEDQLLVLDPHLAGVAGVVPGQDDGGEADAIDDGAGGEQRSDADLLVGHGRFASGSDRSHPAASWRPRPLRPARVPGEGEDEADGRGVGDEGVAAGEEQPAALDQRRPRAATPPTKPRPARATMMRKVNERLSGNASGVSRCTHMVVSPPASPANPPARA